MLARMLSFVFVRFVTGAAIVVRALEILSSVVRSGRAMMLIIIVVEWGKESRDQRSIQGKNCGKESLLVPSLRKDNPGNKFEFYQFAFGVNCL